MTTAAEILARQAENDTDALRFGDQTWSYRELITEASRRCAMFRSRMDPGRPPHVGVLLDNVPDYLFWLAAAAFSGRVIVGINSTYRGESAGSAGPPHRLPASGHRPATTSSCSTASTPVSPRIRCCSSTTTNTPESWLRSRRICRARRCSRRRSVPAHLHLRIHGPAESSAVHPGTFRPDRGHVTNVAAARARVTRSTRRCRSSTRAHCSPAGRRR